MTSTQESTIDNRVEHLQNRLTEAFDSLWDDYVDPREAFFGDSQELWAPVSSGGVNGRSQGVSALDLNDLRESCRRLALTNEFAINGHENRISYIVGTGHVYRASVRKGVDAPVRVAQQTQEVLDEFLEINRWHARQQEIVRRIDRDGEVFLRMFSDETGKTYVRFVEPEQIAPPVDAKTESMLSYGIETSTHDVEDVRAYYVEGRRIDASEIQHRKANVDSNIKRGLPLYTPVRKNLRRAEKLLRNMSVVAEIQSAIALIRKHRTATRSGVEQFVAERATGTATDSSGRTRRMTEYGPGTILDAPSGLDYDFPATGVDASSYVTILQAELRAVAARLVMPEFMFTSDASNANFSSTMVAEGPAVKMFERLQASMIEDDLRVMRTVIDNAISAGALPVEATRVIQIQATPPTLQVRDLLQGAKVDEIAHQHGALSLQTWSQRLGLDYDQEQKNRSLHVESSEA